jgi:hypothetical protein
MLLFPLSSLLLLLPCLLLSLFLKLSLLLFTDDLPLFRFSFYVLLFLVGFLLLYLLKYCIEDKTVFKVIFGQFIKRLLL